MNNNNLKYFRDLTKKPKLEIRNINKENIIQENINIKNNPNQIPKKINFFNYKSNQKPNTTRNDHISPKNYTKSNVRINISPRNIKTNLKEIVSNVKSIKEYKPEEVSLLNNNFNFNQNIDKKGKLILETNIINRNIANNPINSNFSSLNFSKDKRSLNSSPAMYSISTQISYKNNFIYNKSNSLNNKNNVIKNLSPKNSNFEKLLKNEINIKTKSLYLNNFQYFNNINNTKIKNTNKKKIFTSSNGNHKNISYPKNNFFSEKKILLSNSSNTKNHTRHNNPNYTETYKNTISNEGHYIKIIPKNIYFSNSNRINNKLLSSEGNNTEFNYQMVLDLKSKIKNSFNLENKKKINNNIYKTKKNNFINKIDTNEIKLNNKNSFSNENIEFNFTLYDKNLTNKIISKKNSNDNLKNFTYKISKQNETPEKNLLKKLSNKNSVAASPFFNQDISMNDMNDSDFENFKNENNSSNILEPFELINKKNPSNVSNIENNFINIKNKDKNSSEENIKNFIDFIFNRNEAKKEEQKTFNKSKNNISFKSDENINKKNYEKENMKNLNLNNEGNNSINIYKKRFFSEENKNNKIEFMKNKYKNLLQSYNNEDNII